jgi:hypothetical protein
VTATPADIVVRRCAVRVVRHGGWSWGPQPQRLVDQALAALPSLIAARLGDLAPDGAPDVEITEPVRIVVSLTLADLLAGRFDPLRHAAMAAEPLPELSTASGPARPMAPIRPSGTPLLEHTPPIPAYAPDMTLTQFLTRLVERGELDHFLALLPADTLEAWYQLLTASPTDATGTIPRAAVIPVVPPNLLPGGTGYLVTDAAAQSLRVAASPETGRSRQLRDAISAIAARVSRQGASAPLHPAGPAAGFYDHQTPAGPPSASRPPAHAGVTSAAVASAGTASAALAASTGHVSSAPGAAAPAHAASAPAAASDVDIASVLPFLLLSPLAQVGYLSALTPALQPVGLESQTAAFATALAYTVLAPLERAWRRQPEDLAAAAAFAGLGAPVPGPALTEFARVASPALPALDAVVTRALAAGHTAGEPLVLAAAEGRADGGLLLVDREGLFPVARSDTVGGLLPAWRMCGSPPVLVAPAAAGALRGLAAAGVTFVVATPPARGERWRRLPPHRLWTNKHDDPALARHASSYRQTVELAGELMQALAGDRAAVPLAASPALGRSLLLAAGLGLGTLAWTLWREREPTDPLLTLERLADLSARISFEPHRVRVRLPLGPRHADLSAHGLLADVPGVPWFGGRVVEFSGG